MDIFGSAESADNGQPGFNGYQLEGSMSPGFRAVIAGIEDSGRRQALFAAITDLRKYATTPNAGNHLQQIAIGSTVNNKIRTLNSAFGLPSEDLSMRKIIYTSDEEWHDAYRPNGERRFTGVGTTLSSFFKNPSQYVDPEGEILDMPVRHLGLAKRLGNLMMRAVGAIDDKATRMANRIFRLN